MHLSTSNMESLRGLEARTLGPHELGYGKEPKAAFIFSSMLAMVAISIISFCIGQRISLHGGTSLLLVGTSFGLNSSDAVCGAAILLCLVCYLTSKVHRALRIHYHTVRLPQIVANSVQIIYFFLVEKVYIIRSKHKCPRRKDKLYLFNTLGMLLPFCIVVCLTFIFRVGKLDSEGQCYIGLKLQGNIPLLVFDASINIYLTSLFLGPLVGLYSFEQSNPRLRLIAKRTFWGSAATLASSVANLTTIIIVRGHEPGWVCFACCNADVVFSAIVLHWVTSTDYENQPTTTANADCTHCKHAQTSPHTKFSVLRSANRGEFIGPGKRADVITECIGGKQEDDSSVSYQMEGITVRVDHRREIEEASEGGSSTMNDSPHDHHNASTDKIHEAHRHHHHAV